MTKLLHIVPEAAEMVRVSERKLRDEIARGHLRVVRIGRRVLVSPEALTRFIREHEQGEPQRAV